MSHDDPARDPHLHAALRHAPDHDDAPPPALSAAILQAARAAVKPPPKPARPWWRRWLEVQPMQWAGAAAGLLVAVLAGRLWWDNPPELREPAPSVASVPAPAPEAVPATAPEAKTREPVEKVQPGPVRQAEQRRQAAAAPDRMKELAKRPEPPAQPAPAAPAPAPAVAPPPPPAPVLAAPAARAAAPGLAENADHKREAVVTGRVRDERAPVADLQASMPTQHLAPAPKAAGASDAAAAEPPGLQRLRESDGGRSVWSWERRPAESATNAATPAPALADWLQGLLKAGTGRWKLRADDTQPPGESLAWIATWRDDGELRAIVSLQGQMLWWREPDGSTWTATVDPAAAQALARLPR